MDKYYQCVRDSNKKWKTQYADLRANKESLLFTCHGTKYYHRHGKKPIHRPRCKTALVEKICAVADINAKCEIVVEFMREQCAAAETIARLLPQPIAEEVLAEW